MPKVEERVVIASSHDLQHHFDSILPALQLTETEDSWQKIEKGLIKLEVITKSGGYKYDSFAPLFKSVGQPIINSLLSERTKLSGTAADLLNSVAPRMAERFETLVHVFAPALLLICARTNKVALVRAKKCLLLIAKHCKLPSLLPHLREGSKDKSQTLRMVSVEVTLMLLEAIESKEKIGKRVGELEVIVKGTATDRDPEVRQWCKRVFEVYVDRWPERVTGFTSSFTPTTKRYLALPKGGSSQPAGRATATQKPVSSLTRLADVESARPRPGTTKAPASATFSNAMPNNISTNASPMPSLAMLGRKPAPPGGRVENTPSSRSGSGSSSGSRAALSSSTNGERRLDEQEEQRRAALRAELIKQATGTPSQGIAARLALEQFEFQLKKKAASTMHKEEGGLVAEAAAGREKPTGSSGRQEGRSAFAIAMSKKQSPRKGPSRILVAQPPPPPPPTLRKASSESSIKPAQRVNAAAVSNRAKARQEEEEQQQEDVFRSRPIAPKKASSISRSMSAREKLLGASLHAVNRAKPASAATTRSGKGNLMGKKTAAGLKVDVGKENIPPGSELATIAAMPSPDRPTASVHTQAQAQAQVQAQAKEGTKDKRQPIVVPPSSPSPSSSDAKENIGPGQAVESPHANDALDDWSKVASSLDEHVSAPKSTASSATPGPSMSTPIRKPLGALQDNKSHSSPQVSKRAVAPISPLPSSGADESSGPPLVVLPAPAASKRAMILAPSRKM